MNKLIVIGLLLLFSVFVYGKEVVIDCSDTTTYDTVLLTIEQGDTVTASNVNYTKGGDILNKLGYEIIKDSNGRKIVNKTGYSNFYLYIKKDGITEVIYK